MATCRASRPRAGAITFGEDYPYQVAQPQSAWKRRGQRQRNRLVRPLARHRGRRREDPAAAGAARPVRSRRGGDDAGRRSTRTATSRSTARSPTAASSRSPPRASRPCSRRSTSCSRAAGSRRPAPLRLSRAEATRLTALDAALPPGTVEWVGGERLREMAHRLATTARSRPSHLPPGSRRTLRHYQEEGLAWLQFLRERRPLGRAGRRHGPRQDPPGARPHPGREGGGPAQAPLPRRGARPA